jgi:hypothetical protein
MFASELPASAKTEGFLVTRALTSAPSYVIKIIAAITTLRAG